MRAFGIARVLLFCAALGAASTAPSGSAAADGSAEDARWIPAGSIFSMGIPDRRTARAFSDTSGPQEGDSTGFPWMIGGSLEIATPVLADVPGRPRLFAHADVGYAFDTEDPVTSQGDPGNPPRVTGRVPSEESIENVGSSVRVEAEPLVLSGGIGAVFHFEAFERDFRFRPSLEWMYRRDRMRTILGGGETELVGTTLCGPCRTLFIDAQTEKGYHSIGPGLELEVDAARAGDFLLGFYGSFRAYKILGDRRADLVSRGSWQRTDGLPTARPDTLFFTQYEREAWHYRFGAGLRFMWSPE